MAFGAVQQFPNDLRPSVGIGVNLPFSEGNGFTPNYTTAESIRYNLINYFLTNPGERPGSIRIAEPLPSNRSNST